MKWISVSLPIAQTLTTYNNLEDKRAVIERTRTFENGNMTESTLHLPLHTGTHVDYPLHMIAGGKCSSDYQRFPASFKAYVLDLSDEAVGGIGVDRIRELPLEGVKALFFKTLKEPLKTFDFSFPYLAADGAAWLAELPLDFVGTDQPGIERSQPGHETHITLLQRDILIIEGLDLSMVTEGIYDFMAFSMQVQDVEAEPLMVCFREEEL